MSTRVAFLGPAGSFTEQAATSHAPNATLVPLESIAAVAAAVESTTADEAVVPIENSLEGAVTETLDLLIHESTLFVRHELVLPIEHCLLAKPGTKPDEIEVVYSHPQALAQCRGYLGRNLPGVRRVASLSTAAAVKEMQAAALVAAAIGNRRAAALYDAEYLAKGIEDDPNNVTRFVVLAPTDHQPTGSDKTSICFDFDHDAPGILHSVLLEFASREINLAKIESRPTRRTLGRYIFLLDLEGHREDARVKEAIASVRSQVSTFRIFGSYPMHVSSAVL